MTGPRRCTRSANEARNFDGKDRMSRYSQEETQEGKKQRPVKTSCAPYEEGSSLLGSTDRSGEQSSGRWRWSAHLRVQGGVQRRRTLSPRQQQHDHLPTAQPYVCGSPCF